MLDTVMLTMAVGLEDLVAEIGDVLTQLMVLVEVIVPYDRGDVMNDLYTHGTVDYEQYLAEGTYLSVWVPQPLAQKLAPLRVDFEEQEVEQMDEADMWKMLAKKRHNRS